MLNCWAFILNQDVFAAKSRIQETGGIDAELSVGVGVNDGDEGIAMLELTLSQEGVGLL